MGIDDVTDWHVITAEQKGQDEHKVWVSPHSESPREDWWLWKPRLRTGGGYDRLNDVAEVVTSQVSAAIGLPAVECRHARRHGALGVLSRNLAPHTDELVEGRDELGRRDSCYSLTEVAECLEGLRGHHPCNSMSAFEVFAGYTVLDAWVANTDRHGGNWGVLTLDGQRRVLAPAFDHGNALGSGLTDENRSRKSVQAFCRKGDTRWSDEESTLLELARLAVEQSGATWWIERVAEVQPGQWRSILDDMEGLSVPARTFIDKVLTTNQERVRSICQP